MVRLSKNRFRVAFPVGAAPSGAQTLTGALHPEELARREHGLGYATLALTNEYWVSGVMRAHMVAKAQGLNLILGTEPALQMPQGRMPGPRVVRLTDNRPDPFQDRGDRLQLAAVIRSMHQRTHSSPMRRNATIQPPKPAASVIRYVANFLSPPSTSLAQNISTRPG